jgi:anti-anti-sigma factor
MSAASEYRVQNPIVVAELDENILRVKPVGPNVGQREGPIIDKDVKPLLAAAGTSLRALVLDLHDVTFMSSMGLGTCIALRNEANAHGARTALVGLCPELEKLFEMMRIHKLYEVQKSNEDLASWLEKI